MTDQLQVAESSGPSFATLQSAEGSELPFTDL